MFSACPVGLCLTRLRATLVASSREVAMRFPHTLVDLQDQSANDAHCWAAWVAPIRRTGSSARAGVDEAVISF